VGENPRAEAGVATLSKAAGAGRPESGPARRLGLAWIALAAGLLPGAPAGAGEGDDPTKAESGWPHLRGPRHNGTSGETGLADAWPPEGPPLLWMRDVGKGFSSFAAVGGRVYTQTQTLSGQYVVCLDGDTGGRVWEHRYDWPYEDTGRYPGPRATPTVSDGRVYFAGPRGDAGCLRASDGRLLWQVNIIETFRGRGADFGYSSSPLVEDGKVVLPAGGEGAGVIALDARDGSLVWAAGDEPASYASPLPVTLGGRRLVVALLRNALAVFDLGTGRPLWSQSLSRGYDENSASPLYDEPHLLVARAYRKGAVLYRLEAAGAAPAGPDPAGISAAAVWQSRVLSNDVASCVLVGGHVYGFDLHDPQVDPRRPSRGALKCVEFRTGLERWSTDRTGHVTAIAADGKLFLFNDTGEILLARASPDGYEERGRARVFGGEVCWTAPALDRGRLYVRTPTRAACLYVGDPGRPDEPRPAGARPAAAAFAPKPGDLLAWFFGAGPGPPPPLDARALGFRFGICLAGIFGAAALAAAGVAWGTRPSGPERSRRAARAAFWSVAAVLGVVGTPLVRWVGGPFVFTLPVTVFAAYQAVVTAAVRAVQRPDETRARWLARGAVLGLLILCAGYFVLCWRLGLASEWAFLLGFVPSFPAAAATARRGLRAGPLWRDVFGAALAFSLYYGSAAGFLLWLQGG
jgi:outer membrane protein assembly factor BamB